LPRNVETQSDAGTIVAIPPESDIAEIPTTWSKTAHSFKNGPTKWATHNRHNPHSYWPYRPDEANGPKSGLAVSNELRQVSRSLLQRLPRFGMAAEISASKR